MLCPTCGNDMEATGGIPTLWLCRACTQVNKNNHKKSPEVYFKGDTLATLEAV